MSLYWCECGEMIDDKGTPHNCPGAPGDRIAALEERCDQLEERVTELRLIVRYLAVGGALTLKECVAARRWLEAASEPTG